jgi:hypothetical protein
MSRASRAAQRKHLLGRPPAESARTTGPGERGVEDGMSVPVLRLGGLAAHDPLLTVARTSTPFLTRRARAI